MVGHKKAYIVLILLILYLQTTKKFVMLGKIYMTSTVWKTPMKHKLRKFKTHNINYWKQWQTLLDIKIKLLGKQSKIHIFQKECCNK